MNKYLLSYLSDSTDIILRKKYINYLKTNLDELLYGYGDNLNPAYLYPRKLPVRYYLSHIKRFLSLYKSSKYKCKDNNILSLINLPKDNELCEKYNILGSILAPSGNPMVNSFKLLRSQFILSKILANKEFRELISEDCCMQLESLKELILGEYKKYNFKALFIGNGENFICKYHIDIFKQLNRPSFIFLHGLPGTYNVESEKKADYLLVWGEQIRQNYISAGFNPDTIITIGRPGYKKINTNSSLRNDLSNVLVTTTASVSWRQHGWDYDTFALYDRSLIILYCYSVQKTLQNLGVTKATLRVHPSVNKNWITKFIDKKFYTLDCETLSNSLNKSTLVIGPMSTIWLDSYMSGVNYIVYEPGDGISSIINFKLVPPFDGSDPDLVVAKSEDELYMMIRKRYHCNPQIFDRYIIPYNPMVINDFIK